MLLTVRENLEIANGRTTLLRALTPLALRAFWNARNVQASAEMYQRLRSREIFHETDGPQLLGVFLTCASGYADLPPGATPTNEGAFRALLNCRIVLRALRSLTSPLRLGQNDGLRSIRLEYDDAIADLKSIPSSERASDLLAWAEDRERSVYAQLDATSSNPAVNLPSDVRFEGILWPRGPASARVGLLRGRRCILRIHEADRGAYPRFCQEGREKSAPAKSRLDGTRRPTNAHGYLRPRQHQRQRAGPGEPAQAATSVVRRRRPRACARVHRAWKSARWSSS
jgi:hypothetical protein